MVRGGWLYPNLPCIDCKGRLPSHTRPHRRAVLPLKCILDMISNAFNPVTERKREAGPERLSSVSGSI